MISFVTVQMGLGRVVRARPVFVLLRNEMGTIREYNGKWGAMKGVGLNINQHIISPFLGGSRDHLFSLPFSAMESRGFFYV